MSEGDHSGKLALVTGSTSGIGLGVARELASSGYRIMLHGLLDAGVGAEVAADFTREFGVDCGFSSADLRTLRGCTELVVATQEFGGSVDVLVNNAGLQYTSAAVDFPQARWDSLIAVNLNAPFYLSQQVLPAMLAVGWGRIINIASVHGLVASGKKAAYCAAKHGLVGLTKVLALESAKAGVTVNAICPGWVETPLIEPQIQAIAQARGIDMERAKMVLVGEKQPLPVATQPAAIGQLVVFLLSDAAATMTGIALPVDGGWTAQ
ncbi:3-hydroxybutyrate dehydrogenase [uncultured Microbulbifer sp.]|uniref:3-hydroxybutyrate dehydrogenase n=1 Tax=uncultured Microbulbifer sp. TaxID=348147 RepID=UPI00261211DF|nr:3-hydroxybutyrate dehydrogenase [uncultured Microbulbifer sp.]